MASLEARDESLARPDSLPYWLEIEKALIGY